MLDVRGVGAGGKYVRVTVIVVVPVIGRCSDSGGLQSLECGHIEGGLMMLLGGGAGSPCSCDTATAPCGAVVTRYVAAGGGSSN